MLHELLLTIDPPAGGSRRGLHPETGDTLFDFSIAIAAIPYLTGVAAALAGYYLTGFIQEKWSKQKL